MKSISQLFKALGDETRLRIVHLLFDGELCVCDLTHALGMPQSTVSRHLALLKHANIITGRRCKTWAYYRLSDDALPFARVILAALGKHLADSDQAREDLAALGKYRCSPERNCEQPPKRG
ncbi:ArsR/SmtB family transcription factor [Fundidesulfovibrio soli]|uniref:ArsR/SmtB family transcription factor n=1 Tax=Fundidesulfovibrio soli TaxID=2922716 RepID=UPI001FAE8C32|nr:metalloregulator ArsR/SmtB family transcription factor [Fundidesulfovibrio soli]